MANFCANCGSPLDANAAFCKQCGQPAGNPAAAKRPAAASAYAAPVVAPKQGSSFLKIVLVLLCLLAVGGVAVVGGLIYFAHRVKQAVVRKAEENGVDLNSLGRTESENAQYSRLPKPCELISKDEISRLIGEPIERAEIKDKDCEYYGPTGLSGKLAAAELKRDKSRDTDARSSGIELQRMLNRMGAQAGNSEADSTGSDGELPLLVLGLSPDGKAAMSALNLTKGILGLASRAAAQQQGEHRESAGDSSAGDVLVGVDLAGLGDKAMWTPKSGLYVLQGNILIKVNPGVMPDSKTKSIAVARAVIPKLDLQQ